MQFRIHVADRETGEEREIVIEAPTVQQARAQANGAGYLIGDIEPVTSTTPDTPPAVQPQSEPSKKLHLISQSDVLDMRPTMSVICGLILGAVMGYMLGGPFGIFIGGFSGIIAGMGIGMALWPSPGGARGRTSGRLALAGITSGLAVAMFFGCCIIPLNWLNSFDKPNSNSGRSTNSSTYNVGNYREADRTLRSTGKDPSQVSSSDKQKIQQSIQNLSDSLEKNKQYAPSSLDRASDYARREYESNRKIMSDAEARRQYEKDLSNIAQESRDKGISR